MNVINVKNLIDEASLKFYHIQVFLCCIVSLSFDGYDLVVYGATIPLLLSQWSMSPAYAGFIASCGFGASVFGAIIGGALGDKWGRKNTIISSVIIFSIGTFACALANGPVWFAIARIGSGIGMGMTLQNEVALVSEYFPRKYRQTAVSTVATGMQIGGIMSALAALWLLVPYGWSSVYYFGSLAIFAVPFLIKYMPEAPWMLVIKNKDHQLRNVLKHLRPEMLVPNDASFVYPKAEEKSSIAKVFADNRALSALLFWLVYFMNVFVIYGTNTWIPKLMMDAGHGFGASLIIYLALFLGAGIASPIIGYLADRFGAKRISLLLYSIAFVSILLLSIPMELYLSVLVVAVAGVCTMGTQNLTHAYIAQYFPPTVKSTMMGWGLALGRAGGLLGPLVGGVLLAMKATLFQSFLAFAIPCLISAVAIALVQEQYGYNTSRVKRSDRPIPIDRVV
ncbi:MAG: pcaK 1 [Firmicutes bacterium]|nr:pcaK 1 [Bacillota bacterium]